MALIMNSRYALLTVVDRCMAPPGDLDSPAPRRSREHRDLAIEVLGNRGVWDEYEIVGDVEVCIVGM